MGRGIEPLSKVLHFGHPLPHSIKNFVNDDRGTPGGDARLQSRLFARWNQSVNRVRTPTGFLKGLQLASVCELVEAMFDFGLVPLGEQKQLKRSGS